MSKLAAAYGLSDIGLPRICDKHKVPRLPRGYWAKKEFCKALPQTPLTRCDDPGLQTVQFTASGPKPEKQPIPAAPEPQHDPDVREALRRSRGLHPVVVGDALRGLHPLVQATRDALEGAKADRHDLHGLAWEDKAGVISESVSKESVRRALA